MALTEITTPEAINLAKNPVIYELSTDNEYSTAGVVVKQSIELDVLPVDGDILELTWLDGMRALSFEFKTSPDNSGLQLPITGSGTVADYIEDILVPALQANYFINLDFVVSYLASDKVNFVARKTGSNYAFTLSSSGTYTATLDVYQIGVDAVRRENFRVICEAEIGYSGGTKERAELELTPMEGKVIFDLSHLLTAFDKMVLHNPYKTTIGTITQQVIEFQARFAEAFGSTLQVQKVSTKPVLRAIYGGFNLQDRLSNTLAADVLPDFLTHRKTARIRQGQPYLLHFYNDQATLTALKVKSTFYYTDGTNEAVELFSFNAAQHGLYLIPVGYNVLVASVAIGKTLAKADVWLQTGAGGSPYNSKITLKIHTDPLPDEIYLAYRNSYGLPEYEFMGGYITKIMSSSQEAYQLWKRYDALMEEPRFTVINKKYTYGLILRSGHRTKDEAELMGDLLASDRHYLIVNQKYIPVQISYKELELTETYRDTLHRFELEVKLTEESNYSDIGDRIG